MTKKESFINKKQLVYGIILGILSILVNLVFMYFDETLTIDCGNYTKEYNRSELNKLNYTCGNAVNIYKYNDNTGFGVYFPDKDSINYAIYEYNANFNNSQALYIAVD